MTTQDRKCGRYSSVWGNALEPLDADLVEQQRQNDRHREAEQKIQYIQQQCVGNSLAEIAVLKDLFKTFSPTNLLPA